MWRSSAIPERVVRADHVGGRHSTGVRWWVLYHVWGLGKSPLPDSRRLDFEYRLFWEERLEDYVIWLTLVEYKPSGQPMRYEARARWRAHPQPAQGLRHVARLVDQPPPMEHIGCTPEDLATGMAAVLDGSLEGDMWRAALAFVMLAMASLSTCPPPDFGVFHREIMEVLISGPGVETRPLISCSWNQRSTCDA